MSDEAINVNAIEEPAPAPPPETAVHPDDGVLVTSVALVCVVCDPGGSAMRRATKTVSAGQTEYTYECVSKGCMTKATVSVPHNPSIA